MDATAVQTLLDSIQNAATMQERQDRIIDLVDTVDDEVRKNAAAIAGKVDAVMGKGLSTNDYTAEDKAKLAELDEGAQKTLAVMVRAVIPVGYIHVQLPNTPTPDDMWGAYGMTWQDVSADYAGAFLRVAGGDAAEFGTKQEEGLPNITGTFATTPWSNDAQASGCFTAVDYSNRCDAPSAGRASKVTLNASRSSAVYGASTHVTPVNYAVKIWKRTA